MSRAMKPYPSQRQDRFVLRLPDGLRDVIRMQAAQEHRSMNDHINYLIELGMQANQQLHAYRSRAIANTVSNANQDPKSQQLKRLADEWVKAAHTSEERDSTRALWCRARLYEAIDEMTGRGIADAMLKARTE